METTTLALLDHWKKHHGIVSDYAAARRLNVTAQALSNWRRGRSHADVEIAARMAEELGLEVIEVLAAIQADRETRAPAAAIWRRYGRPAFIALVASVIVPISQPGEARGKLENAQFCTVGNATDESIMRSHSGSIRPPQHERWLTALHRWIRAWVAKLPIRGLWAQAYTAA